jgi:hypothetical protein
MRAAEWPTQNTQRLVIDQALRGTKELVRYCGRDGSLWGWERANQFVVPDVADRPAYR